MFRLARGFLLYFSIEINCSMCLKSPSPWKDKGKEETETRRFASSIDCGMKSDFRWTARCIESIESQTIYGLTHIIRCAAVFHTRVFPRTNCWADFLEILHGWLLDDSKWDSRGTFFIFDLEPLIWGNYWNRGAPQGYPLQRVPSRKSKKCLDYPTTYPQKLIHAKFEIDRPGSLFWRVPGQKTAAHLIIRVNLYCL